jgi:hypothetical protein
MALALRWQRTVERQGRSTARSGRCRGGGRIRTVLDGQPPRDTAFDSPSWGSRLAGWVGAAASTTTAIGLITYGLLRLDYGLFYVRFGLKPEDIGLGQAELISQSLVGVLLMLVVVLVELLFLAISVWIIQVLVRKMGRDIRESAEKYGWAHALLIIAILVFVLAVNFVTRVVFEMSFFVALLVSIGASMLALAAFQGSGVRLAPRPTQRAPPIPKPTASGPLILRRTFLVVLVAGTIALVQLVLALSAVDDARRVRDGRVVRPTVFGLPLVSWGALPARIVWTSGGPPEGLAGVATHCLLYLGRSSGAAVFFDHDTGETVWIPLGGLVISITPLPPNTDACAFGR